MIKDVVRIEDKRVRGIDVMLIDVSGYDYWGALDGRVFYIEEAVSKRSIADHISKQVQIVLGRLEPSKIISTTINHIQSLFSIG